MKKKIILNVCVLGMLIASSVFAQETIVEHSPVEEVVSTEDTSVVLEESTPAEEVVDEKENIVAEEKELNVVIPVEEETSDVVIPAKAGIQYQELPQVQSFVIEGDDTDQIIPEIVVTATTTASTTDEQATSTEVSTTTIDIATSTPQVHILIRNGNEVLFDDDIILNNEAVIVTDIEGVEHTILGSSTLALLYRADQESDAFEVSDIQYFDAFDALYLKCITVEEEKLCENWQYVINGFSPGSSIDTSFVGEGDELGFYFGSQYQLVFDAQVYATGTPIIATAEQYQYQSDTWIPRTGVTIGVTTPNPLDSWTPLVLATYPVDANGEAIFTIATSGVYQIGIAEDYYYPTYAIEISTSTSDTNGTTTATSTDSGGGSGGGSGDSKDALDIQKAISFLKNLQASNGSYGGSGLYSDWVAIAFAAAGEEDNSLLNYLKNSAKEENLLTDNERRAMAILAFGENPYDFEGINYIEAIVKEFDGIQFGDSSLVNDDIFALIVLSKSGYESDDVEIKKAIEFILSKQKSNGSWEGSADLTAAAIQMLNQFKTVSGVSSSLSKAKTYLKNSQQLDGGWGSVYSTGWVTQAMYEVGEDWSVGNKTPQKYLANAQQEDGGLLNTTDTNQNRIWATSYAISAALEMSWNDILESVSKPKEDTLLVEEGNGENSKNSTSTATTTEDVTEEILIEDIEEVATTTLPIALTTYDVSEDKKIVYTKKETESEEIREDVPDTEEEYFEDVQNTQLAAINQVSWLKQWWTWLLGGVLILGGGWGLRRVF